MITMLIQFYSYMQVLLFVFFFNFGGVSESFIMKGYHNLLQLSRT